MRAAHETPEREREKDRERERERDRDKKKGKLLRSICIVSDLRPCDGLSKWWEEAGGSRLSAWAS